MKRLKLIVAAFAIVAALAGCSSNSIASVQETSEVDIQAELDRNQAALDAYVEAERAAFDAQWASTFAGLYSSVDVWGRFQEPSSHSGLDDGLYAIVQFDYVYAAPMDWNATIAALDLLRPALDEACATAVFPAMRAAGITGPIGVVYTYDDPATTLGTMWEHGCNE